MPPLSRYMTYQPWTIRRDARLAQARDMMREHHIRHLPVLEGGELVGVLSDRDLAVFERGRGFASDATVEDAMTQDVQTAQAGDPVDKVVDSMVVHKHGCIVVIDRHNQVEGIFTTIDGLQMLGDVLRRDALIANPP
ncbi:MAG TPA: CBS domain-containing protein [Kofleriaceae bacterium]|nr:CBS domain-containing protein [Kofleriaceae bacterium]